MFALVLAVLVLPLPAFVQVMQSGLADPSISPETWLREPALGTLHALTGIPATVMLWSLPLWVGAIALAVPAGFERAVSASRIDPGDRAWSSFVWALHSWRGALRWFARLFLPMSLVLLVAAWVMWESDLPVLDMALEWGWDAVDTVVFLTLPFFVLDARNYARELPHARWSARWPTRQVWFLFAAVFAVLGMAYLLGPPNPVGWLFRPGPPTAGLVVGLVGLWLSAALISALLSWWMGLAWLSRADWPELPSVWRRGLHPRVLATCALQWARPAVYVALALLPLAAWMWLFVALMPTAEAALRGSCCADGGFWPPVVATSRHLVAWWWVYSLGIAIVFSNLMSMPLRWFGDVAWSRLMVELGLVDAVALAEEAATPPPTRPDCAPATTAPPTA